MKIQLVFAGGILALAGCQSTTGTGPTPLPIPVAAGYADGTKNVDTEGLIFSSTTYAVNIIYPGVANLIGYNVSNRKTSVPANFILILDGQEIPLEKYGDNKFQSIYSPSHNYNVQAVYHGATTDGQVDLVEFIIDNSNTGRSIRTTVASGLTTDPIQVNVLSGSATYTGIARLDVFHFGGTGRGIGTATIDANFATGQVSGSMSIVDENTLSPTHSISPTTILIDPTTISGNGFSTTLSINAADLAMNSVNSSRLDGSFFGVNAVNVGGTFWAQGISSDGVSPVTMIGGFIGE